MPKPIVKAKDEDDVKVDETSDDVKDEENAEASTEGDQAEETTETTEAEPSAEELQAQLDEKDAEIARLKEAQKPKETVKVEGERKEGAATQTFLSQTAPSLRAILVDEKSTPEQRFQATYSLTNKMLGAVMEDQVRPQQMALALAVIEINNKLEMIELSVEPAFKPLMSKVREELENMRWTDRAEEGSVRKVYHRLLGEASNGKKVVPISKASSTESVSEAAKAALKDVSKGSGAMPAKVSTAGLTTEQEAERSELESEAGNPFPAKLYLAKLKSRQDRARSYNEGRPKSEWKKIPSLVREI